MPLITDRDILIREPSVFIDPVDGATALRNTTDGSVSGSTLTSASSNFVNLGIDFGHVAVVNDVPCEVIARLSATQLTVSLPRASSADPQVDPTAGSNQRLKIPTYKRLIDLAEAWTLGALGLDADDPDQPLTTADVVDLDPLKHLIATRVIQQAFAIAAAINSTNASLKNRADEYKARLGEAKRSTQVLLKLDGDSNADARRRLDVITMVRN